MDTTNRTRQIIGFLITHAFGSMLAFLFTIGIGWIADRMGYIANWRFSECLLLGFILFAVFYVIIQCAFIDLGAYD